MDLEKMVDNLKLFEIDQDLKKLSQSSNNFFRKNTKREEFYNGILERIQNFEEYVNNLFKIQIIFSIDYLTHFSFFCFYFLFKNYLKIKEKFTNQNTQQIEQLFLEIINNLIIILKNLIIEKKKQLDKLNKTEKIQHNSNISTIEVNSKINMIKKLDNMKNLLQYINYSEEILKEVYKLSSLFSQGANIENLPKTDYNSIKRNIESKKTYAELSDNPDIKYELRKKRLMTKEEYELFIDLIKKLEENLKKEELTFDEYNKYFSQLYNFYKKCNQIFMIPKDFSQIGVTSNFKKYYSRNQDENIFSKIKQIMVDIAIKLLEKFPITEIEAKAANMDSNLHIILDVLHSNHFHSNYQIISSNKNSYLRNSQKKNYLISELSRRFEAL